MRPRQYRRTSVRRAPWRTNNVSLIVASTSRYSSCFSECEMRQHASRLRLPERLRIICIRSAAVCQINWIEAAFCQPRHSGFELETRRLMRTSERVVSNLSQDIWEYRLNVFSLLVCAVIWPTTCPPMGLLQTRGEASTIPGASRLCRQGF